MFTAIRKYVWPAHRQFFRRSTHETSAFFFHIQRARRTREDARTTFSVRSGTFVFFSRRIFRLPTTADSARAVCAVRTYTRTYHRFALQKRGRLCTHTRIRIMCNNNIYETVLCRRTVGESCLS